MFRKFASNRIERNENFHEKLFPSGISILEISKTPQYDFWYGYTKRKYGEKAQLCYIDTDSVVFHIKTKDIYINIAKDVERRFNTPKHETLRPLPRGKY